VASDDKTEEPSQRRLDDARKKGQVPKSQELNSVVLLFMAFYILKVYGEGMFWSMHETMRAGLAGIATMTYEPATVMHTWTAIFYSMGMMLAPFFLFLFVTALLVNFFQVGVMLTTQGLTPNFSKMNPMSGLSRMFSKQALVMLIKAVANISIALYTLQSFVQTKGLVIFNMTRMDPFHAMATLAQLTWDIAFRIIMVLMVIAFLDYMYQKWQHHENLKMTKQEVKDEYKQQEGDPHIKGKIRAKQREAARKRMMSSVPQANVVVTNPLHLAVAMQYDFDTMESPKVVAKGQGFVADRIRELARAHAIPIIENRDVARALYDNVEIDQDIPPHLYQAVAEIIAYLYHKKFAHLITAPGPAQPAEEPAAPPPPPRLGMGGLDRAVDVARDFQKRPGGTSGGT
jgi:flagellar biosynthetic protein FlhB